MDIKFLNHDRGKSIQAALYQDEIENSLRKIYITFFSCIYLIFSINNGSNLEAFYCCYLLCLLFFYFHYLCTRQDCSGSISIRIYFSLLFITKTTFNLMGKQYRDIIISWQTMAILTWNIVRMLEYLQCFAILCQYWREIFCHFIVNNSYIKPIFNQ